MIIDMEHTGEFERFLSQHGCRVTVSHTGINGLWGLDPDEYHNCRKVRGEGTMKLHDKIKHRCENGDYDQQVKTKNYYSSSKLKNSLISMMANIITLLLLFFVSSLDLVEYMSSKYVWIYYVIVGFFISNIIGLVYSVDYYFYLKKQHPAKITECYILNQI